MSKATAVQTPFTVGTRIAGRYDIRGVLGQSEICCVYAAFDRVRREEVAMKFLHPHAAAHAGIRKRFIEEARIAKTLSHPGLLQVFDLVQFGEEVGVTAERLNGRNLRQEIRVRRESNVPFTGTEVNAWLLQLCDCLMHTEYAVAHSPIKPENIWVCDDGSVRLMDAAFTMRVSSKGHRAALGAKRMIEYWAPEKLLPQGVDLRSNQYSLGRVAIELIQGSPDALEKGIRLPVAKRLGAAIQRAASKNPADRFPSTSAFRVAISPKPKRAWNLQTLIMVCALIFGVCLTLPLWPSFGAQRYQLAVQDVEGLKREWREFIDQAKDLPSEYYHPDAILAGLEESEAERFRKEASWKQANHAIGQAKSRWSLALERTRKVAKLWQDPVLQEYLKLAVSEDNLPTTLINQSYRDSDMAFREAKRLVDQNLKDQAFSRYEEAIRHLGTATGNVKTNVEGIKAWLKNRPSPNTDPSRELGQLLVDIEKLLPNPPPSQWRLLEGSANSTLAAWNATIQQLPSASPDRMGSLLARKDFLSEQLVTELGNIKKFLSASLLEPARASANESVALLETMAKEWDKKASDLLPSAKVGSKVRAVLSKSREVIRALEFHRQFKSEIGNIEGMTEFSPIQAIRDYRRVQERATTKSGELSEFWKSELKAIGVDPAGTTDSTVTIPNLIGSNLKDAMRDMAALKLQVTPLKVSPLQYEFLFVKATSPSSGETVLPDETEVRIEIMAKLPDFKDRSVSEVMRECTDRGIRASVRNGESYVDRNSRVLDFEVPPADQLPGGFVVAGSSVTLIVGNPVPELKGKDLDMARVELERLGFVPFLQNIEPRKATDRQLVGKLIVSSLGNGPSKQAEIGSQIALNCIEYVDEEGRLGMSGSNGTGPAPPPVLTIQQHANPPLDPVEVELVNHHSETLLVLIKDRRHPDEVVELAIGPGKRIRHRFDRDSGGTGEKVLTFPDGRSEVLSRFAIPPKSIYLIGVMEERIESVYIDRTGTDRLAPAEYQPDPVRRGARSIGTFSLTAGERLFENSEVDLWKQASRQGNPGDFHNPTFGFRKPLSKGNLP